MSHVRRFGLAVVWLLLFAAGAPAQTSGAVEAITVALRAGNFAEAAERSRVALLKAPNDARLWTLNGLALAGAGKRAEALQSFQRALKIDPNHVAALEGAGQVHYEAGSRRAVPLLERLLRLRPGDPTAHAMIAVLEYRAGNCKAAVEHFDHAGAAIDTQLDAPHAHATCLVRLQQIDAAIRVLQRAVALEPAHPRQRQLLAAVQLMGGKPEDAIATLTPLLQAPNANADADAETLGLASAAYEKTGDTPRAVATLRQAILLEPRNIDLYLDFANIAFAHQSFQAGVDILSDGLGLRPDAAPLHVARGVLYVQLADYDKAEADFAKASELDPNQALSDAAQGLAACRKTTWIGRWPLAIDPDDQTALYRLIQALRRSGDKTDKTNIPELLKRLAALREKAAKEERERYR